MLRHLALLLAAFLMLAFVSPLLHQADVARYAPDIALVVVLYVGLTSSFEAGLLVALLTGLVKDGFAGGSPVGLYAEVAVIVFLVVFRISRRLALRSPVTAMLVTVVFSLGSSLLELLLSLIFDRTFGQGASGAGAILTMMVPQAVITAPFAPVVFYLLDRLDALTTRKGDSVYLGGG